MKLQSRSTTRKVIRDVIEAVNYLLGQRLHNFVDHIVGRVDRRVVDGGDDSQDDPQTLQMRWIHAVSDFDLVAGESLAP